MSNRCPFINVYKWFRKKCLEISHTRDKRLYCRYCCHKLFDSLLLYAFFYRLESGVLVSFKLLTANNEGEICCAGYFINSFRRIFCSQFCGHFFYVDYIDTLGEEKKEKQNTISRMKKNASSILYYFTKAANAKFCFFR